ncbi:MAG: redoxin domain-containing protein [Clostridia bacterium]|nr:redoxin domain-containing protein [Clostridia bacterium]
MNRSLSLLLAALLLICCASALAETTAYKELGFAIDFPAIQEKSVNHAFLANYGVMNDEPYVGYMGVIYTSLPKNVFDSITSIMNDTGDKAEYNDFNDLKNAFTTSICEIIVTDAKTLAEAGIDGSALQQCEVTEFAALGDYHYFFIVTPVDRLLAIYDEAEDTGDYEVPPQEMKAVTLADIELIRSELLKQLRSAELFEPEDTTADYIGQVIEFESVDLDGNAVRSADLFRDNKITMVNLWGTWCVNCINEMDELAELHKRMQERGCGIVGVEYETGTIEDVADAARKVFADNGVTYPNVWMPRNDPLLDRINSFPFTFFVDSEGRILSCPISGAAVNEYGPTFDKLLAGEAVGGSPETCATENGSDAYRVFVYDTEGNPVNDVIVQFCDESACSFQKTDADGIATFQVEMPKVYDVHIVKVPEGYVSSDETCKTLDTFSDVNIFITKGE